MCRAFVILRLDDKKATIQNQKGALANYMHNSHNRNNHDGFFAATHKGDKVEHIRDLKLAPVMRWIDEADLDRVAHGHARMANRGGVCDKYIHGWKFNGHLCTHNGTVDVDKDYPQDVNDSVTFFRAIFSDKIFVSDVNQWIDNIKEFCEKSVTGQGVFFITNEKYTIAISLRKEMYINLINENLLLLNSQNDIHEFQETISIENKDLASPDVKRSKGLIEFRSDPRAVQREQYQTSVDIEENLTHKEENVILYFENESGDCTRVVKIDPKVYWAAKNTGNNNGSNRSPIVTGYRKPGQVATTKQNETVEIRTDQDVEGLSKKYLNVKESMQKELADEKKFLEGNGAEAQEDDDNIFALGM